MYFCVSDCLMVSLMMERGWLGMVMSCRSRSCRMEVGMLE